ncbi:hypothetical protein LJC58_02150 [Lachnospiraceae bacterium OttesenSCG-928-D06]|nr:hypothetical protein [Lachnospiraceae bacterium OttesenSCG-928-D06]
MATAKKEKVEGVTPETIAPEVTTPQQEAKGEDTAKKAAKKEKVEEKVYNFTSANKWLSCSGLGVQFLDGKASTTNVEVAKALVKLDGVELVEND